MCRSPLSSCSVALALIYAAAAQHLLSALHRPPPSSLALIHAMNVSQEEYMKTFSTYIKRLREKDYSSSYEKKYFLTFTHSGDNHIFQHSTSQLEFKMRLGTDTLVERATLRLLVSGDRCTKLKFYQVRADGSRKHLETLQAQQELLPQWRGIEAESKSWDGRGAKFEVEAPGCKIASPALHLLLNRSSRRTKRSTFRHHHQHARTDCPTTASFPTAKKQKCCRHKMDVVFKDLPGYEFIIQPYRFDAGYCKGSCPYRYNPANHHASLQSLIWRQNKGSAPKPCCAPSKLEQLEIIHLDEDNVSKLKVTTWSNMKVLECACF